MGKLPDAQLPLITWKLTAKLLVLLPSVTVTVKVNLGAAKVLRSAYVIGAMRITPLEIVTKLGESALKVTVVVVGSVTGHEKSQASTKAERPSSKLQKDVEKS